MLRPNDCNISTQQIATLLAQPLNAPAKRLQHFNTTYRNVVGPAFESSGQTIATCQRSISQHCWAQHVACVWPPCCGTGAHVLHVQEQHWWTDLVKRLQHLVISTNFA